MEIVSLIKAIPAVYKIDNKLNVTKWKLNDIDRNVLEAALLLKKTFDGNITVISVGPEDITDVIREALAYGGDMAYHIVTNEYIFSGTVISAAIESILREIEYNIILSGEASSDLYDSRIGALVASRLGLPFIPRCKVLEENNGNIICTLDLDKEYKVSVEYPFVLEITREFGKPKIVTILQLLRASKKIIHQVHIEKLIGKKSYAAPLEVIGLDRFEVKRERRISTGSIEDSVNFILDIFREERIL